jgi:hypothetical protein
MEWEPVFILGVTGGAMLISAVRNVIGTGRRDARAEARPAEPRRSEEKTRRSRELHDLDDRLAVLEWIAAPAARAAAETERLRRGAA